MSNDKKLKALFNGEIVEIEISEEAKKQLKELKEKLDLGDVSDTIKASVPVKKFLAMELNSRLINIEDKQERWKIIEKSFDDIEDIALRPITNEEHKKLPLQISSKGSAINIFLQFRRGEFNGDNK